MTERTGAEQPPLFANTQVATSRLLYTPSPFARETLLHLQEAGTLRALQPHTSRREGLSSFLFIAVLDGAGTLTYEGVRHPLRAGECAFIDCRSPYAHRPDDGALWTLKWVHFNGPALAQIYRKYRERGGRPVFRPAEIAPLSRLSDRLYETGNGESHIRDMEINSLLAELLTLIMRETVYDAARQEAQPVDARQQERLAAIKAYLDENYDQHITLDALAARFYMEKTYLARRFKGRYGVTVINYLNALRVTRAKALLRFGEESVETIAARVGVEDRSYFCRLFRKLEGVSPSEYRKRW